MVSVFSEHLLGEQIANALGETLSEQEMARCLALVEIVEPPVARQFWQTISANPGIYIVLVGKVRLLDSDENLVATLSSGSCFGEATLFSDDFQPYVARASANLKLCYLKQEVLQALIERHPSIRDRLLKRSELWDLVMLCHQNWQEIGNISDVPGMLKALSLFERHDLSDHQQATLPKDCKCLVLQKGELRHSEGQLLTAGKIYPASEQDSWQIAQSTIAYIIRDANWLPALEHWQQLAEFVQSQEQKGSVKTKKVRSKTSKPERITSSSNIIPFPQQEGAPKQKQQQQKEKIRPYFPSPKVKTGQLWGNLIKSYPFYAQHSASDCGAACLVMIGRYWGKNFSVNRLRELSNASRQGATLRALAAAAESVGFATRPVKASFDKLAEQPLPAVAHWEGYHYIVIYKITKRQVIVGDPAIGQRVLTHAEFKEGWTGYALLLQPTVDLKNAEEATHSLEEFFELVKPHWRVLLEVFFASLVLQLFGLVTPIFSQLLFDKVIIQGSVVTLNAVCLGMVIFSLFGIVINAVRQYLLSHTANRISVALLVGFLKHTFRLPLGFFESRYVGDITSRIQENQKIQRFLTGETLSIVLDLLTLFIYLGVMLWYSWSLTLVVLLAIPPFFILAFASTGILRRMSREIFNAGAESSSYLIQSLTGIRSIRSMAVEQTVRWRWEELLNNVVKKGFTAQVIGIRLQVIGGGIDILTSTMLLWYGAWLVINQELTIGQLIAFNMLKGNVISPFKRLSLVWNQLQEIFISVERLNDVLKTAPEEDLLSSPRKPLRKLQGHIRFDNVTFRYHPESDTNVLENLSFEIKPEQMVAVVGRSGSGKTTLSKLILGLYPPTSGKVLIDGHDINNISLQSLRSQVGIVDQSTFLFGGTIRENISIAHPDTSLEEVTEAARLAGADEFIQRLPMGYETEIGEGGGMLSGGQRQRVAIARALLGNPRLLVFDEATSNLDAESERIIQNNLKTILKGRTSLVIAHRLSTVRKANLILVLDHGVLVESGTHDELIAKQGHYYYLNQQQLSQAG
ncbi:ABC transporter ATP-binding protein [Scytonema hofmannii PCC 7110]|uniref:ABC transporter ATP-binding protein n=1 Tax=Scytonema hofmannii PCC 7110 TaxID=128403 RepID=A0A139WZ32_9CYAN|nr:peptidase domain-containing ABC transporter [Scytonema hofmannii]KYC37680.1 ABC transporter ATP-binding protein [Scytonema hofmannii PCC 7110]